MASGTASLLQVTTPASAGFGLTTLLLTNQDGTSVSRKDLFRFYSDTISFTDIALIATVASGFVVSKFSPLTQLDLAFSLSATNTIRVMFTRNGTVLSGMQKDYSVGNNPGPLAAADFDKSGAGHPQHGTPERRQLRSD